MGKERIALFGTGIVGDRVLHQLENLGIKPIAIYDNNSSKWGKEIKGIPVSEPGSVSADSFDRIAICSSDYYDEIYEQLCKELLIPQEKIVHWTYWSRQEFLNYYSNNKETYSEEIQGIIEDVRNKDRLDAINYSFINEVKGNVKCEKDETCGLLYTIYKGKRLYLKRSYQNKKVAEQYVESLLQEQDERSPHRYLDHKFRFDGGILVDGGAAEGNFALDVIEKADHVYLIEVDENWNEALEKTFEPWIGKITIINKFLSDVVDENNTTIDELSKKDRPNFIKLDIEGAETSALKGAKHTLTDAKGLKIACCTYHNNEDEDRIREILEDYGFSMNTSEGYMVFPCNVDQPMRLVKGILRAEKDG